MDRDQLINEVNMMVNCLGIFSYMPISNPSFIPVLYRKMGLLEYTFILLISALNIRFRYKDSVFWPFLSCKKCHFAVVKSQYIA